MRKIIVFLLATTMIICSAIGVNAAMGYHSEDGFHYEADTSNNLSVAGFDGTDMVIPAEYIYMPVVKVKALAFKDNTSLESVSFENAANLVSIGTFAFSGCTGLTEIFIPSTITTVSTAAFKGCSSIAEAAYATGDKKVPNECFRNCTSLSDVVLGDEITTIGNYAFASCSSLTTLTIPRSVSSISTSAFKDTPVTLGVYYGSYAHGYALDNNIPYVLLDDVKLGDAGGDGSVNVSDVTTIQRYLAELETLEGIYLHAADANQDGTVDISDATIIQMYLAEYEMEYPIGDVMTQ